MKHSKLAELREKTDRQLVLVIARRLDSGLEYALSGSKLQAKSAQREVRSLMPLIASVTTAEKRRLETKLAQLEATLREATGRLRIQTACS
jgi:hypothetical protein